MLLIAARHAICNEKIICVQNIFDHLILIHTCFFTCLNSNLLAICYWSFWAWFRDKCKCGSCISSCSSTSCTYWSIVKVTPSVDLNQLFCTSTCESWRIHSVDVTMLMMMPLLAIWGCQLYCGKIVREKDTMITVDIHIYVVHIGKVDHTVEWLCNASNTNINKGTRKILLSGFFLLRGTRSTKFFRKNIA